MARIALVPSRAFVLTSVVVLTVGPAAAHAPFGQTRRSQRSANVASACEMASIADIAKTTGLTVKNGTPTDATARGTCTWIGAGTTKIVLTLEDAARMRAAIAAQQQQGGTTVPDLGLKAESVNEPGFPDDAYVISVLDGNGGFEIRLEGKGGSQARALALAKLIESRR